MIAFIPLTGLLIMAIAAIIYVRVTEIDKKETPAAH